MALSSINRRTLLQLAAASAALAACDRVPSAQKLRVAVVGGGIVGASIAYHLAAEGVAVTVLERDGIAQQASHGTFAWVNATWAKQPRGYHQLNQLGVAGWQRLQATLDIPVRWGGSLEWFPEEARQDKLATQIAEQAAWGEPAQMLGRKAAEQLEPQVDFGDATRIAYSPNDGALDPVLATNRLIEGAVRLGAVVKTNCAVTGTKAAGDGSVLLKTSRGDLPVDRVVLATGADQAAPGVLGGVDIPQRTTPGVILVTKPVAQVIGRIIVAPGVHIHQRGDGRIVLGEQEGAPDTMAHAARLQGRPTRFPADIFAQQHADRMLQVAEKFVPGIKAAEVDEVLIGWRPLPLDGHPVLGPSAAMPSAYLAIMHSGVSLAPIVGEVVAREIVTGQSADQLAAYRPDRAFEQTSRY